MPEEHLVQLQAVLERFLEHGLKLKPSKCHFFWTEIDSLGHKVTQDGMILGTDNIRGITEMAPLMTVTEVRRFLGATRILPLLHQGIHANIAKPLSNLLSGNNSKLKSEKSRTPSWSPAGLQRSEDEMYNLCLYSHLLTLRSRSCMETDASKEGLGAVL